MAARSLPNLTSLALHQVHISSQAAETAFTALAPRLVAFSAIITGWPDWVFSIPLLVQLRSLTLQGFGQADTLAPLHQLEFLHLRGPAVSHNVFRAIRRLSVEHKLRALRISFGAHPIEPLVYPELDDGITKAALTSISLDGIIDPWLFELPSLTALTVDTAWFDPKDVRSFPSLDHDDAPFVSKSIIRLCVADPSERPGHEKWACNLSHHLPALQCIVTAQCLRLITIDLSLFCNLQTLEARCDHESPWAQLMALGNLKHFHTLTLVGNVPELVSAELLAIASSSFRRIIFVSSEAFDQPASALKLEDVDRLRNFRVHLHSSRRPCRVYALAPVVVGGSKFGWKRLQRAMCEYGHL